MQTIHLLPPEVVSHIAAGEVIARPAYALKELIDNALDAHASWIRIRLLDGGLELLQVEDDGIGMSSEDLELCWQLHATSKITTAEDVVLAKTYGFRGEALASIAAVAILTISTKQSGDKLGLELVIDDGKPQPVHPVGRSTGTTVKVEHLFANTPARKQFLRSTKTELRHCIEMVENAALAHPEVRFTLSHDGKRLLDVPTTPELGVRLNALFGEELREKLLPVASDDEFPQIHGWIARPELSARTTSKQWLFVNGRRITEPLLSTALRDAFGSLLDPHSIPVAILFLTLPPEHVDVNVHPRKEVVTFASPTTVYTRLHELVKATLGSNNLTFYTSPPTKTPLSHSILGRTLRNVVEGPETLIFTQLHRLYLVAETPEGMILIDQHAAHERILFEKYKAAAADALTRDIQLALTDPVPLKLSARDLALFDEFRPQLKAIGFSFDQNDVWMITKVPSLLADRDLEAILRETLGELEKRPEMKNDHHTEQMLETLACKSAIKAGQELDQKTMQDLYQELQRTPNRFTCPHGRPTMIAFSLTKLNSMFKRSGSSR